MHHLASRESKENDKVYNSFESWKFEFQVRHIDVLF